MWNSKIALFWTYAMYSLLLESVDFVVKMSQYILLQNALFISLQASATN